jgi:hypothetical protein
MAEHNWAKEKSKSEEKVEKEAKPDDDEEAFDALEAEQKEFLKVCIYLVLTCCFFCAC